LGTVEARRPVQKPVQLAPQPPELLAESRDGGLNFQLFAMTGLFRNQQVAGSSPAGGSSFSITYKEKTGQRRVAGASYWSHLKLEPRLRQNSP
jgi:hypothetical protein